MQKLAQPCSTRKAIRRPEILAASCAHPAQDTPSYQSGQLLEEAFHSVSDVRVGSMLLKKRFSGGLLSSIDSRARASTQS
jgi:hypothetical protein